MALPVTAYLGARIVGLQQWPLDPVDQPDAPKKGLWHPWLSLGPEVVPDRLRREHNKGAPILENGTPVI